MLHKHFHRWTWLEKSYLTSPSLLNVIRRILNMWNVLKTLYLVFCIFSLQECFQFILPALPHAIDLLREAMVGVKATHAALQQLPSSSPLLVNTHANTHTNTHTMERGTQCEEEDEEEDNRRRSRHAHNHHHHQHGSSHITAAAIAAKVMTWQGTPWPVYQRESTHRVQRVVNTAAARLSNTNHIEVIEDK